MNVDRQQCRTRLLRGIIEALEKKGRRVLAQIRKAEERDWVCGLSLDLVPWEGFVGLSWRLNWERDDSERYYPASWKYYHFVSDIRFAGLKPAAKYIQEAYDPADEDSGACQLRAHLIFLAGAEALLDESVAAFLQSQSIDAPTVRDDFVGHTFEYMVLDPDRSFAGNYCELVIANRVTARAVRFAKRGATGKRGGE